MAGRSEMSGALSCNELRYLLGEAGQGILAPELLASLSQAGESEVFHTDRDHTYVFGIGLTPASALMAADAAMQGGIAAGAALSLLHARGVRPMLAVPLLAAPTTGSEAVVQGMIDACRQLGVPCGAGRSVEGEGAAFGLALIGQAIPMHLKSPGLGQSGDRLVLAKPLGFGIYADAARRGGLPASEVAHWLGEAGLMDAVGPMLACLDGVHAMHSVQAAGLLASLGEMCRASGLHGELRWRDLPRLPRALELSARRILERGFDQAGLAGCVFGPALEPAMCALLSDPQTAGGLLVSCAPDTVTEVLSIFLQQGFDHVSVIGELHGGSPGISVF